MYDSIGIVCPDLCDKPDSSGECSCDQADIVPTGTFGVAKHYADSCKWKSACAGRRLLQFQFEFIEQQLFQQQFLIVVQQLILFVEFEQLQQ